MARHDLPRPAAATPKARVSATPPGNVLGRYAQKTRKTAELGRAKGPRRTQANRQDQPLTCAFVMEPAMGIAALPPATLMGFAPLTPRRATGATRPRGFDSPQHALTRNAPMTGGAADLEPAMGIEPITTGLQGRCSTIEPRWRVMLYLSAKFASVRDARLLMFRQFGVPPLPLWGRGG